MFSAHFPASRHPLCRHAAYLLAAATIGLALFSSGTPSPLYGTYSQLWGFDSVVLTLVYATYAFGVLTTLLLAGRLSDEVGRRPVLIVSMSAWRSPPSPSCSPTRSSGSSSPAASKGWRPGWR